ncbi:SH3 domain-containing protein [Flavobacterium bizetiae]|uniref:SH3 domain-containing protein n=1 Tax=Flavobacterium bizetiae TaxID=2704140 RepID=UPI0021E84C5D|nr:SH3 domain-containing protein [Flavobacterium bizetiae]UTN03864.1 SH3 domain-containing protein [Flavobacterium bizetiae]
MKKYYLFILLFTTVLLHSQERYFLNSDTRLYTSANTSAEFLGYFRYGAEVQLLSESKDGWYKVKADNLSEGYIPEKFIATRLNARDVKVKDGENPLIESDDYYGSNHLFVLVAGLKARAQPDKNAKIREILNTGDPVAINYLPKNQEDWVNISGQFNDEYAKFTLRKFVGKRPDFNSLLKDFDKLDVTNITERKTIGERLVELAWNSETTTLAPAYQRYYEVVKQLNDPKLLADTELNMAVAKGLAKHKKPEEILAFVKKSEFILKGLKTKAWYLTQKDLVKIFGKPTKTAHVNDECGVYLSELFYYYPDLEASVDEQKNQAEITKVFINESNKLVLNPNATLDHTLTEKAFIEKYGAYINASIKTPHIYAIQIEDSEFRIEFKDGKIFTIEIFFYC